jgi:PAS domain S-box-containing protein
MRHWFERIRMQAAFAALMLAAVPAARAEQYYFRLYTAGDGLSQAVAQALYQDRAGHLWIGTQAGLNRYDGTAMTVFGVRQGMANDWVNAIAEDAGGRIWAATLGGVSVWDGERFANYTVAEGLPDNRATALAVDAEGTVWCATARGLCRFDGRRWIRAGGLSAGEVNALLVDRDGRLWAATAWGLAYRRGEHFDYFDEAALHGKNVRTLAQDGEGRLWLGLDDSVRVYQGERLVRSYTKADGLERGPVAALCLDRWGTAWLGTPQGLGTVREGGIDFIGAGQGLKFSDVRALLEDREGILWIGVYGGLYKFQGRAFTNYTAADGLGSDTVRPVLRDRQGRLWAGTTGGLSRLEGRRWRNFTVRDGLSDNAVEALLEDSSGNLWIGTRAGLTLFDGRRFVKDLPGAPRGRVMSLVEDREGAIWCAGRLGAIYRRAGGSFAPVPVEGQSFSDARLLLDPQGRLWVSGDNGLSRWDGRQWRTFTVRDGLAANQPYFLCNGRAGRIWFGYHSSSGLTVFDGMRFAHYTTAEGLSNDAVYSLGMDREGNLWVGTARGVDRFDGRVFTHFDTEDGYASDESNAGGFFADADGSLWFGTMGGLSRYDPRFDPSAGAPPRVELSDIRLGRERPHPGAPVRVGYRDNDLSVRVAALTFANEKRLAFQYRLRGLSDEWLALQGRSVWVPNLSPASYTLEVRARRYQGAWSEPARFEFTVREPFWASAWFRILCSLLIVLAVMGIFRLRTRAVLQRNRLLETRVAERTAALQKAEAEARKRAAQAALLYQIGRRVSSKLELDALLAEVVDAVRDAFGYYGVMILLADEGGKLLKMKAVTGGYAGLLPPGWTIATGRGMIGTAAATGATQVSGDVSRNPHYLNAAGENTRSELAVPLMGGDRVVGVLDVQSDNYDAFGEADVTAMEALSSQIVAAIENARLYERVQRELDERRAVEEALARERNLLRTLIDNLPDPIFVKDAEGRFVDGNSAHARALGARGPDEIAGKSYYDFFPEALARMYAEADRKVILQGEPCVNQEEPFLDRSSERARWALTTKVPLFDRAGAVVGLVGISRDITELKQAEDALRESEEKYRYLVENINEVIFSITADGTVSFMSPAIRSILAYDPEEIVGRPLQQFVMPEDRERFERRFGDAGRGRAVTAELRMIKKTGEARWMRISEKQTFERGKPAGSQGVLEDITERKDLEGRLLQAQKLESIGQLAAGIAHEINTPIQYVGDNTRFLEEAFAGFSAHLAAVGDLIASGGNDPALHELAARVARAREENDIDYLLEEVPKAIRQSLEGIARVADIVRAMKEFSHPSSKEKTPVDINRAIQTTITVARNEWKYVAEMETDLDPALPQVPCLPGEFNQVILNLITNAAHAIAAAAGDGSKGKGTIRISTRLDGDFAEIRVSDTGTGIPEAIRSRIFDPFFTTKEVGRGTGQGLSLARSIIVKLHGGTIDFQTEVGKGTTFIIRLPLNREEAADLPRANGASCAPGGPSLVEDPAHHAGELPGGERLADEVRPRVQEAVVGDGVVRVTGDV